MEWRVVLSGVGIAAIAVAGCGRAATPSAPGGRHDLYQVTVVYRGVPDPVGPAKGWLEPADGRYRIVSHQTGSAAQPTVTMTDVGAPGIDETTTVFAGMPQSQTTLAYGSAAAQASFDEPAMDALRAYLGLRVPHRVRFTVGDANGHLQLTLPLGWIGTAHRHLPARLLRKLRTVAARGRIVVTILRAEPRSPATERRLFAIDPATADEVLRALPAGTAPTAPRPAYWLGRAYRGMSVERATSTIATHRGAMSSQTDYDVAYGGGARATPTLDIDTSTYPNGGGDARAMAHAFGGHAIRIRLADGTPAKLLYQRPGDSGTGVLLGTSSPSGPPVPPGVLPPFVVVFTDREQILIDPGGPLTRAQAIALAESLRPL